MTAPEEKPDFDTKKLFESIPQREPSAEVRGLAGDMRELLTALVDAGFTKADALDNIKFSTYFAYMHIRDRRKRE